MLKQFTVVDASNSKRVVGFVFAPSRFLAQQKANKFYTAPVKVL